MRDIVERVFGSIDTFERERSTISSLRNRLGLVGIDLDLKLPPTQFAGHDEFGIPTFTICFDAKDLDRFVNRLEDIRRDQARG